MSSWLGSLFGSAKPAGPTLEQEARQVAEETGATIGTLQEQYDDMTNMIQQLGKRVKQFNDSGMNREATRAFKEMQTLQKRQAMLGGKIDTLSVVGDNVQDMHSNVAIHSVMTRANKASTRIGSELKVDDVNGTMDEARDHMDEHNEVSMALAGNTLVDPVDEDEMANDMASFLAKQNQSPIASQEQPMLQSERVVYQREQLVEEEEVARMLDALPAPGKQVMSAQQRSLLAQNQYRNSQPLGAKKK